MPAMFLKRTVGMAVLAFALLVLAGGVQGSDRSHVATPDAGVYSVSDPCYSPSITVAQKLHNPKRIKLLGSNFTDDMTIYINDTPAPPNTWRWKSGKLILKHSFIKLMPKHSPAAIRIVNNCGAETTLQLTR